MCLTFNNSAKSSSNSTIWGSFEILMNAKKKLDSEIDLVLVEDEFVVETEGFMSVAAWLVHLIVIQKVARRGFVARIFRIPQ